MSIHRTSTFLAVATLTATLLGPASAQGLAPQGYLDYSVSSGNHSGGRETYVAFEHVVSIPRANWIRVHFGVCQLGSKSYIHLTSLGDGAQQTLDAPTLDSWRQGSAYFNGGAVRLALFVHPDDRDVVCSIDGVLVNEQQDVLATQCGPSDDRVSSTDPAVGRIVTSPTSFQGHCTAWIVSNGAFLSAGHCVGGMDLVQFNVPPSLCNGVIQHPDPSHQFPILQDSIVWNDQGSGQDWAVFECAPNASGISAINMQGSFYRMSRDSNPQEVRITGYGSDSVPLGCSGDRNDDSSTQQTHSGAFVGEIVQSSSDVVLQYAADTEGGTSGSPIIVNDQPGLALGIHTFGGCSSFGGANGGTGFESDELEAAIQSFVSPGVVYLDSLHPSSFEEGTVMRPFSSFSESIAAVPPGAVLSIVAGSYPVSGTVISSPMLITAPVGTAIVH